MNHSSYNGTNQNYSFDCYTQNTSSYSVDSLFQASSLISKIVPAILMLIGFPGNIITMILSVRQRKTMTFTALSLLVVSIADTIALLTIGLPDWIKAVSGYHFSSSGTVVCKLVSFLASIAIVVSGWGLIAITTNRMVCLVWPYKAKAVFTPKLSAYVHACIFVAACGLSVNVLLVYDVSEKVTDMYGFSCGNTASLDHSDLNFVAWNWVYKGVTFLLPFLLLIIENSIILFKLSDRANNLVAQSNSSNRKKDRRLYILVMLLCVVFFISQFPLAACLVLEATMIDWVFSVYCTDQFLLRYGIFQLLFTGCLSMALLNPSINFLLYVVASPTFRQEIKNLFMGRTAGIRNAFAE